MKSVAPDFGLPKPEKRQDRQDNDDQADDIDNVVHEIASM
jgi:hypothetical protein